MSATIATRSGLTPQPFDAWLEQTARLDREAAKHDSYAVASLILSDLDEAVRMAKRIEQAGIRALEFNIGTPYASVTARGNVTTEFDPARVTVMVSTMREAISCRSGSSSPGRASACRISRAPRSMPARTRW